MGRSQETFNKKEVRSKKEKKKKEKEKRRLAKKEADTSGKLEDMIAYVDEFGNLTSTPPDPEKKQKVKKEDIEINIPKKDATQDNDVIRKGVVTFFNDSKGFGFITEEGTKTEHFVHISGLIDEVREGDEVEFELEQGQKGLNAVKVKVI